MKRVYVRGDLATRFWAHVDKSGECWLWTGARQRSGHGKINVGDGRIDRAHRVAFRLTRGEIPDGKVVCHSCDNPPCVRPAHLFLGTQGDNVRDMMAKGRGRGQFELRTHCYRGHALTDDNVIVKHDGVRCRICENAGHRERRRKASHFLTCADADRFSGGGRR